MSIQTKIEQHLNNNGDPVEYTSKDFSSDQDVRWCPGCGDYTILKQVQNTMPDIGVDKEDIVFISGIGCAARFPILYGYFWNALYSWPCTSYRYRIKSNQA
jgi:2-oxoglutarate/2-oxoacid ferredoxin oxidoreductase subunit beta